MTPPPIWLPFEGGVLRRFRAGDEAAFRDYRSDPALARFQGWTPPDAVEAAAFVAEMAALPPFVPGQWLQLAIADAIDDRLLGDVGLGTAADARSVELGFTVARAAQGRGVATRAVAAVAGFVFAAAPEVERIVAIADARNLPSLRVLARSGFQLVETQPVRFRGEDCIEHIHVLPRPVAVVA